MFSSPSLQILLLANVFLVGVLVTIAVRYAYLHFRAKPKEKPQPSQPSVRIPAAVRDHLLQVAEENLERILNQAAADFKRDLEQTTTQLDKQLVDAGSKIIDDEMKQYQANIAKLRDQASDTLASAQEQISKQQTELRDALNEHQKKLAARLAEETAAEQAGLRELMDAKLADAVVAFLTETLQHNIDLGAQSSYLVSTLEEHKAELTKEVIDEA